MVYALLLFVGRRIAIVAVDLWVLVLSMLVVVRVVVVVVNVVVILTHFTWIWVSSIESNTDMEWA